jgi:CheY-like chemotaxis protein
LATGKAKRLARDVAEIRRASERGAALTRQLLAFSRGQLLGTQVIELNRLVADTAKLLRRLIGRDIELRLRLDPDTGRIDADPGQIEQLVMNLALNARDAMPRGGRLTVETRSVNLSLVHAERVPGVKAGPYARLSVHDTGCGMTPEVQARLFEPFFTTKEPGRGTGLGLSTVDGIVRQHRGCLEVESEPGRGSTFRVYLPRVTAVLSNTGPRRSRGARPRGRETLLVVEPEAAVRELLERVLGEGGYTVLTAGDGAAALAVLQQRRDAIDLVLGSVVIPRVGRLELAARLRALSPRATMLYLSGHSLDALQSPPDLNGRTAVLQKPFTPDALLRKVREVLDVRDP